MASSRLSQLGGLAAMLLSGLVLLVGLLALYLGAAFGLGTPVATPAIVLVPIGVLSLALLAGMAGFHAIQKDNYGQIGYTGFYAVLVALVAAWLGVLPVFLGGTDLPTLVRVGLWGLLVGFVLYGVATLQAGVLPRWCGIAFIVALPVTVALAVVSLLGPVLPIVLFGLIWLTLSHALWTQSRSPTQQPQRAR